MRIGEAHVCAAAPDPLMVMVVALGLSKVVVESSVMLLARISSLCESAGVWMGQVWSPQDC